MRHLFTGTLLVLAMTSCLTGFWAYLDMALVEWPAGAIDDGSVSPRRLRTKAKIGIEPSW